MTVPFQNRIVGHEDVDPMTLKGHVKNIRTHASAQRRLLESALDELGHVGKIVVSQRTRRVLNGHLRVELAIGRDEQTIPVTWIDVDEDEELIVLAFFDQIGEGAEIDPAKLKAAFGQVKADTDGLQTMLADWAASYQVTIVPATATLRPERVVSAPVPVASEIAPAMLALEAADQTDNESTVPSSSFPAGDVLVETPVWEAAPFEPLPVADALPERAAPLLENPSIGLDEQNFSEPEQHEADMFASALKEDRQVIVPEPPFLELPNPQPPTPNAKPAKPAPTTALIAIGEYTQQVDLARFTPWFNKLVLQCGNDGANLAIEIKARLGFGA